MQKVRDAIAERLPDAEFHSFDYDWGLAVSNVAKTKGVVLFESDPETGAPIRYTYIGDVPRVVALLTG